VNRAAPSESPSVHSVTPISTRSLSRNWPGSADSTGTPPACVATTPGVVNKKLSVPTNSTTASALPAADTRGHTIFTNLPNPIQASRPPGRSG
jgi:hypothetical protein